MGWSQAPICRTISILWIWWIWWIRIWWILRKISQIRTYQKVKHDFLMKHINVQHISASMVPSTQTFQNFKIKHNEETFDLSSVNNRRQRVVIILECLSFIQVSNHEARKCVLTFKYFNR